MKIVSIDTESDIRVPSAFATGHRNDGGDNAKDTSQDWMEMKSKAIQPQNCSNERLGGLSCHHVRVHAPTR